MVHIIVNLMLLFQKYLFLISLKMCEERTEYMIESLSKNCLKVLEQKVQFLNFLRSLQIFYILKGKNLNFNKE